MTGFSNKVLLSSYKLADLLCYPKFDSVEYRDRINELRSLNIKFVILEGPTVLNSINILGKGNEGLVLKVRDFKNNTMAVKIKRTDSCRIAMENEFNFYKYVNLHNIGPSAYLHTKNMLLMECIEGLSARKWFFSSITKLDLVRRVILDILNQCFKLDVMGIDHGQLNKLDNHVIISHDGSKCTIVDFESASRNRKVNNVTSAIQGLFFRGPIAEQVKTIYNNTNMRSELQSLLTIYKKEKCRENFDSILSLIKCD
ncbi:serine/threonine protein kinase [Candidatus Nitrosocosmicus franklandus]|uniref:Serine/threonine protein kinase n=1 Tax=Candidatus Nitrosocosmicus franklandianus TaxID=1798806 RepID=A0A484IAG2_9ARCH|nr:serine/threonine protein kinase [Candidatus Nitrosocosmicus franklandus]VFJ13753.1 conserved protein of unknown function [Candidatus Nitrosocosmicus franklandus]